jgi:homopolymeric O-antigen transport system ATP-binding protein
MMSGVVVEFDHVWKKFRKGEIHDSLRDLIPAVTRSFFSSNHKQELDEQEFWALRDVSFQIKRGEVLGIIGPNGAGKSTILKLLSKILVPNKGRIAVKGRLSALIEVGAGFHPDLTGRENIYLNGTILGMKKQEIDRKLDEIIAFSGIEEFIDTPVKRYSSGMYARLGFSVAAHVSTEVLLVDEVLAVGDAEFQKKCLNKMDEASSGGRTVVFISHNLGAVQTLCPRAIELRRGQVAGEGPTQKVVQEYLSQLTSSTGNAFGANPHRTGDGRIRFVGARILADNGQASSSLISGRSATFEFEYENPYEIENANVNLTIYNHCGIAAVNMDMVLTNFTPKGLGKKGKFRCCVPNLPLPTGTYRVAVMVTALGRTADHISNALAFDVVASVFYASGRSPNAQYSACMLQHSWEHERG